MSIDCKCSRTFNGFSVGFSLSAFWGSAIVKLNFEINMYQSDFFTYYHQDPVIISQDVVKYELTYLLEI